MDDQKEKLSKSEICGLIESCGQHGVVYFKLGELVLRFHRPREYAAPGWQVYPDPTVLPPDSEISGPTKSQQIQQAQTNVAQDALAHDELSAKEEALALMRIEDPFEYERLVLRGDLTETAHSKAGPEDLENV